MATATYNVKGMTCDHCVRAVTEELGKVAGVTNVAVDLASGKVTVSSGGPIDDTAVRGAVEEAGYTIAT
jgi:copper chaperone